MKETLIQVKGLQKTFGDRVIFDQISLDINQGDVITIIGPSGAGKSTFLRCLNLLEEPTAGEILFHGQSILAPRFDVNHYRAKVGMVFQSFNLFKNMNVLKNCMLGQEEVLGRTAEEAKANALDDLRKVDMAEYIEAMPNQLSGGQQQRVAIARALSMDPEVLLFDEPTSALDPKNVKEILEVMQQLASDGSTMVVVTHEMSFARQVSNRICYLDQESLRELDSADEIDQLEFA